jgi:hypothetical protein
MPSTLLSPAAAAKLLSEQTGRPITLTTLRNWRAAGKGPAVSYFHGKWPCYSQADLDAFVKRSTAKRDSRHKPSASISNKGGIDDHS